MILQVDFIVIILLTLCMLMLAPSANEKDFIPQKFKIIVLLILFIMQIAFLNKIANEKISLMEKYYIHYIPLDKKYNKVIKDIKVEKYKNKLDKDYDEK